MTLTRLLSGSFKAVLAAIFFGNAVLALGGVLSDAPPSQRITAAGFGVALLSIAAGLASFALVDFRPGIDLAGLRMGGTVVIRRSRRFAIGCAGRHRCET